MQDLRLNLLPLGPVVEEQKLDLAHDLVLALANLILLHLERALDISQQ